MAQTGEVPRVTDRFTKSASQHAPHSQSKFVKLPRISNMISEIFDKINCWKKGDSRAPNKPLLLLLALAHAQRGERWLEFRAIESDLRRLLLDFGPPRQSPHPEYPFWRLLRDGLWDIPLKDEIAKDLTKQGDAKVRTLRETGAKGGFKKWIFDALKEDPEAIKCCAQNMLNKAFPASLHEELLQAVGLDLESSSRQKRDRQFRLEIIRIYERRCAVCGYDGQLGHSTLGLEAAHVKWHAAGGPDVPENGIALCSFHHVAFDRGALSLDDQLRILVSQEVVGRVRLEDLLLRFVGCALGRPQTGTPTPDLEYIRWHRREVFRHPARFCDHTGLSLD
jgi:putative restriction endonuclease